MLNTNMRRILITSASLLALGGCGANDIASPGSGGNINITYPAPTPTPTPTPTATSTLVTPANGCPTIADPQGLAQGDGTSNTITGPTGTYLICTLPAQINRSISLPYIKGIVYRLPGRVDVGTDGGPTATTADTKVTLSIEPGVIVYGGTGSSWLAVNRGNSINAVGTATRPIIFTSRDNILGNTFDTSTQQSSGQWGGVVLMGRAQVTDCIDTGATPGTVGCIRDTEGLVSTDHAYYGGATNTDNSGVMKYVQIRYSGYVVGKDSELQSLTTEGIGSATQLDYIQSFNSSDDGAEFFGGHVNFKHYISVGAEDDNLDTDTGVKANFQYVIVAQRSNIGDAIIEADTDNPRDGDNPRQNTRVVNFTFIDRSPNASSDQASILLRGGTDYGLYNGVLASPDNPCLRVSRTQTAATAQNAAIDEYGAPQFQSVVMQCNTTTSGVKYIGSNGPTAADVQALFGSGTNGNNDAFTPTLTGGFINGANETAVTAFDATTLNGNSFNGIELTPAGFFTKTTYIGAVNGSADTWYQGWTCNSGAANFGTGNSGLCTSLPTA